jgi:hypothetical protein
MKLRTMRDYGPNKGLQMASKTETDKVIWQAETPQETTTQRPEHEPLR